jgi:micrococcal nuclease
MKNFKFWIAVCVVGIGIWIFIIFIPFPPKLSEKATAKKAVDVSPSLPIPTEISEISSSSQIVFVPRVIDGDTIVVETVDSMTGIPGRQETVRYIGMDTPETVDPNKSVECYGHEASERNKELVAGKYVRLEKDVTDRDKYGRLLRFVYAIASSSTDFSATTSVNIELVKEGYARVFTIPPNTEYKNELDTAAAEAKAAKIGFWGACAKYPFVN